MQNITDLCNLPLSKIEFDPKVRWRILKACRELGIETLQQLIKKTDDELMSQKGFGISSLVEIREKLAVLGLKLKDD